MTPRIVSIQDTVDYTEAVSQSVDALKKGKIVVFPTETVYGLAALSSNADAVKRLCIQKGRLVGHALSIAISGYEALQHYAPTASDTALAIARHFWPGPVTLVLEIDLKRSMLKNLPDFSLKAIMPEKHVGFRVPQNEFLLKTLQLLNAPIVLTSANLSGKTPAKNALEARDALGSKPDLIIDDGEAEIGQPSTVVKIDGCKLTFLRKGSVPEEAFYSVIDRRSSTCN